MFGDRLRYLRGNRKLRQEDVARLIGVARTTYAMYEQGSREPDNDTLIKIASFYETSTDYLLGKTDDPSPETGSSEKDSEWDELYEVLKKKGAELEATAILRTASKMDKDQLKDIAKVFDILAKKRDE